MNDDFAPFELTVKLKEKGYQVNNETTIKDIQRWLSKEFKISVWSSPRYFVNTLLGWECDVHIFGENVKSKQNVVGRHKREKDALIKGIEYVLDNLI